VLVVLAVVGGALALVTAKASLSADSAALAKVDMPLGGGTIQSLSVVTGPNSRPVPVTQDHGRIWPRGLLSAHQQVTIDVVVKRPGWISWLAGSTEKLHLTLLTPSAKVRQQYLTVRGSAPLRLRFDRPVAVISYGAQPRSPRHLLASPQSEVTLARSAEAGSLWVAGAPRRWETAKPTLVSWFPAGAAASAVASPAPGASIKPSTPITLTFSKPIQQALGNARPPVSPITPGTWHSVNSHTMIFQPQGYGYGLGAKVTVGLPNGVRLVGSPQGSVGTWTVPGGSPLRVQQLLAILGYLPLSFHYSGQGVAPTAQAEEAAAVNPPAGHFSWRYGNVPSALRSMWQPGASGVMTRGALMAFQNEHGLTPDGVAGPVLWRNLINSAVAGHRSTFGYAFVTVSVSSQRLALWHNGHSVMSTAVNTGIASAPTVSGTFPVFSHIRVGTMSGTNPDGSHYHDPGIQYISYFNGGDALHAFDRAQFGFPQSLGCVEMALGPAGQVWPYTPVGTLVHVA
jgi:peptidoglycan hydrolase-like protein with peptidoglycan-binding domain